MAQQRPRGGNRSASGRPAVSSRPPQASRAELAAQRNRLLGIVEPVVAANGYDLDALTISAVGRRHVVRVVIDGDRGVSLEAVAELSRKISAALDEVDQTSGFEALAREYQLEVGSPGVDRPLTQPRHWRRNMGRLVKATVGERTVVGRITATDSSGVTLDVGGTPQVVAYGELGVGRVQVEFTRLDELADDDLDQIYDEETEEGVDEE
jgi:ribosome maturation factor RimP